MSCDRRIRQSHSCAFSQSHLMTSAVLLRLAIRRSIPRFQPCITGPRVVNLSRNRLLPPHPRHLSSQSTPVFVKPQPPTPDDRKGSPKSDTAPAAEATVQEQRKKDWNIMRKMMEHMWPQDWGVRSRVVLGLGLLVSGKVNHALNQILSLLNTPRVPSC